MNRATVFQGLFIPTCIIVLSFSIGVFVNSFIDRKSRQKFENVGVSYDSDLDKVERVTLDVAHEVMKRINYKIGKKPAVRFNAFADSSINFNVIFHSSEFENRFMLKPEFTKALTKKYREESINSPYPIRMVLNEK